MALLAAVAGQAATALENGRLYRQLQIKADELERLREFSENILESLNDGLRSSTATIASSAGTAGSRSSTACATSDAVGRPLDELFEPAFVEVLRAARRESPEGRRRSTACR